jgi:hypothetical protein
MTLDVDELMQRTAVWTAALGLGVAIALGLAWDWAMALGVVAGAALGYANLWMAARALRSIVASPQQHRPVGDRKWALPLGLLVKWPLVLLALGGILWYSPARPEGVALGVAVALAAASMAALRGSRPPGTPT